MQKIWKFRGSILINGKLDSRYIELETSAPTKKKALANLSYRYKKARDIYMGAKLKFVGKVEESDFKPINPEVMTDKFLKPQPAYQQLAWDF